MHAARTMTLAIAIRCMGQHHAIEGPHHAVALVEELLLIVVSAVPNGGQVDALLASISTRFQPLLLWSQIDAPVDNDFATG